MSWFQKIFNTEKAKISQNLTNESTRKSFSLMLQSIVEEAIAAVVYWLVGLMKQGLESEQTPTPQAAPPENSVAKPTGELEELLPKVSSLIEQLYQRSQAMIALESRIGTMEKVWEEDSKSPPQIDQSNPVIRVLEERIVNIEKPLENIDILADEVGNFHQSMARLESRIVNVERLSKTVTLLTRQLSQVNQTVTALDNRMAKVENVLGRYGIVPKLVDQQSQAIAALQNRIATLESSQDTNQQNSLQDRLFAVNQTHSVH